MCALIVHLMCMSESPNVPVVNVFYQAKVNTKVRECHEVFTSFKDIWLSAKLVREL